MTRDATPMPRGAAPLADAWLAARLFAAAPTFAGGVLLHGGPGPVRDRWLADLRAMLPADAPCKAVPVHVDDERLLGGIDLVVTLHRGAPVFSQGVLAQAEGGVVLLSMAERAREGVVAHIAAGLDGERFGVVAFDESAGDDAAPAAALLDRLAFHVDLRDIAWRDLASLPPPPSRGVLDAAAARLVDVDCSDEMVGALCAGALALGIGSIRASLHAVRVARLAAALDAADAVTSAHAAIAAGLVLGPRAQCAPPVGEPSGDETTDDAEAEAEADADKAPVDSGRPADADASTSDEGDADAPVDAVPDPADGAPRDAASEPDPSSTSNEGQSPVSLDDQVLAAATAALPAGLLALAGSLPTRASRAAAAGRSGALRGSGLRGRPAASRRARTRSGARLDIIATLRAAAPWQRLRGGSEARGGLRPLLRVRAEDFHATRFLERGRTTTVFAVDASGSSALHRLAEAKGAVELLLADCYVRRDSVAVIGFRGRIAEVLLPPTRSLARAKRSLAELPGGGGTPLASGIDAALALAITLRRRGDTPVVVVLSDGRANIRRDGVADRAAAESEALAAARALRAAAINTLFIDTSPRPQPLAQALAEAMEARYLPLPHAEAATLSAVVRGVTMGHGPAR